MLTTTYHQTAIDTTGVEEANRADLLEALARESADVKAVLEAFEEEEKDHSSLEALRNAFIFCAIFWVVAAGAVYLVHHYAAQIDGFRW
jgi:hypothetical protein